MIVGSLTKWHWMPEPWRTRCGKFVEADWSIPPPKGIGSIRLNTCKRCFPDEGGTT